MAERATPINKRYRYAARVTVWTPEARIQVEGPITNQTSEGAGAIIVAVNRLLGLVPKKPAGKRRGGGR